MPFFSSRSSTFALASASCEWQYSTSPTPSSKRLRLFSRLKSPSSSSSVIFSSRCNADSKSFLCHACLFYLLGLSVVLFQHKQERCCLQGYIIYILMVWKSSIKENGLKFKERTCRQMRQNLNLSVGSNLKKGIPPYHTKLQS